MSVVYVNDTHNNCHAKIIRELISKILARRCRNIYTKYLFKCLIRKYNSFSSKYSFKRARTKSASQLSLIHKNLTLILFLLNDKILNENYSIGKYIILPNYSTVCNGQTFVNDINLIHIKKSKYIYLEIILKKYTK